MNEKLKNTRPRDGDQVRQRGASSPIMLVENDDVGAGQPWEGVPEAVYCSWVVDGNENFEIFSAKDLVVVSRDSRA